MNTLRVPSEAQRLLLAALSVIAIVGGIYGLAAVPGLPAQPPLSGLLQVLVWNVGYGVLALLIAWRGGHETGALLAGWFLSLLALQVALQTIGVAAEPGSPSVVGFYLLGAVTYGVGIRFTQSFPTPLTSDGLRSLPGAVSRLLGHPAGFLLGGQRLWVAILVSEVVQHGLFPSASIVWHVLLYAGVASFYLAASLRLGGSDARRRVFWILEGVLIYLILEGLWTAVWVSRNVLDLEFGMALFTQWLTVMEGAAALVCFAIAIFFYGAFDSGLVLRRTVIVSVLSGLTLVLIVALEEVLAGAFARTTGIDAGIGAVLGGVLAALAFRPVSARLDRVLRAVRVAPSANESEVGSA